MTSLLYLMDDVERCKMPAAVTTTFAAVAVVLIHISQYFERYGLSHFSPRLGYVIAHSCLQLALPTFMFLAGATLVISRQRYPSLSAYGRFESKKLLRLVPPFVAVSLMTSCTKPGCAT